MSDAPNNPPRPPKRVTISKNWVTLFAFILPVAGIFAILWGINDAIERGSEMAGAERVGAGAGRTGMSNQFMGETGEGSAPVAAPDSAPPPAIDADPPADEDPAPGTTPDPTGG